MHLPASCTTRRAAGRFGFCDVFKLSIDMRYLSTPSPDCIERALPLATWMSECSRIRVVSGLVCHLGRKIVTKRRGGRGGGMQQFYFSIATDNAVQFTFSPLSSTSSAVRLFPGRRSEGRERAVPGGARWRDEQHEWEGSCHACVGRLSSSVCAAKIYQSLISSPFEAAILVYNDFGGTDFMRSCAVM